MTTAWLASGCAVASGCVLASGCGGHESRPAGSVAGDRLTIYSSQPLSGYEGERGRDVMRAQRLALSEVAGRVRGWRIHYVALSDTDPTTRRWSPALVAANAKRAAANPTTIAYLGELDSGASAVAIPILNQRGILAVSPLDGVSGLTRLRGAGPGEPDKYYPTRVRNFARLVPPDDVQAAAIAFYLQDARVSRLFVAHDDSLYGGSLALNVQRAARRAGIRVVGDQSVEPGRIDPRRFAGDVAVSRADGFLYAGQLEPGATRLLRAVHAAAPRARLVASSALADDRFAAGLGPARAVTRITTPMLEHRPPLPAEREFSHRFQATYGHRPDRAAVYGYEAMRVVLAAIRRAGGEGNRRPAVVAALQSTRARPSALGRYGIDGGDVTTETYGLYRIRRGRLVFDRVLDPLGA